VSAFHSAFEAASTRPEFAALTSSLQPLFNALTNTARTVALAVVSTAAIPFGDLRGARASPDPPYRGPARPRRGSGSGDADGAQLADLLRQVNEQLPEVGETLRATLDRRRSARRLHSSSSISKTLTLRPLAAALNFSRHVDPALVRYTARIAALMMAGTAVDLRFRPAARVLAAVYDDGGPAAGLRIDPPPCGRTRSRHSGRQHRRQRATLRLHLPSALVGRCHCADGFRLRLFPEAPTIPSRSFA